MNLKVFRSYLKSKKYSYKTIQEDCLNVHRFLMWMNIENEAYLNQLSKKQLVAYIDFMKSNAIATSTINIRLRSIRKFFDHLKMENIVKDNIADITVKGEVKKVVIDPLDYSELEQLYKDYLKYKKEQLTKLNKGTALVVSRTATKREVMLGFMLFQGLHSGELKRLEIDHIKDEDGTVYIVGSKRSKARHLKLHPAQMRTLFSYLESLEEKQTNLLFTDNVNNQMTFLCEELRGLNQKVQNGRHIRASVLMHWLKLYGKRQTQYMIGHKWISSTEVYELQDLESLTNQLEMYHPLNGNN